MPPKPVPKPNPAKAAPKKAVKSKDASIIAIIQEMVQKGESEEMIVSTLHDLGIDPKKAKRLLLLGQADTFALLRGEISKIVQENVELEKPKLAEYIRVEAKKAENEMTKKVEQRALNAFKEDQAFIENQATMFQSRINQGVKNIMQLNEETKKHIGELSGRLSNIERDVWSLKHRVFGSKLTKGASVILIGLQIGLVLASGYLLLTSFAGISTQVIILGAIIGSIIAAMIFIVALSG